MSAQRIAEAIAQIKEKDFAIRRDTMQALAEIADAEAVRTIIGLLEDPDWIIRARAAEALGEIRDPAAAPMLIRILQDQENPAMESGIHRVHDCAARALGKIGSDTAIVALRAMLTAPSVAVRFRVARALLEAKDEAAIPALAALLQGHDSSIRYNVIRVLGESGDAQAVPVLMSQLNVRSIPMSVQAAAAEALLQLGDSETLPRKILASPRLSVSERIRLLDALRRLRFRCGSPHPVSVRYKFADTHALCRRFLRESDGHAQVGAQMVLNWLNGDRNLLIASQPDSTSQSDTLLRAAQGSVLETRSDTLLRPSDTPPEEPQLPE